MNTENYLLDILEKYLFNKETIINDTQIKMYINSYFIFIINLDKDVIRRQYIKLLMKKMNINYNLIIVKPITKELFEETLKYSKFKMRISEMGCCLSHLWCLNYAIQNNIKKFIIFEDDIIFHKNFHTKFENITKDKHYDFLMLGACDFNIKKNLRINDNVNNQLELYRPSENSLGGHANLYSIEFAKIFLKQKLNRFTSYDMDYKLLYKNKSLNIQICNPNLVVCELSTTNLNHDFSFFNAILEEKYYSDCFINFNYHDYYFIYLNIIQKCIDNNIIIENHINYNEFIKNICNTYTINIKNKMEKRLCYDFFNLNDIKLLIENIKNDSYS